MILAYAQWFSSWNALPRSRANIAYFADPMPSLSVILIDNSPAAQGQDHLPGRLLLQKEAIDGIITQAFETDREALVGIIPIAQQRRNDIITPTKHRAHLSRFLDQCDVQATPNFLQAAFQAGQALSAKQIESRTLFVFLCAPFEAPDEVIASLYEIAGRGASVRVVCFGDAVELGNILSRQINFGNFSCCVIGGKDNFASRVPRFLGSSLEAYDPELQEALRLSMQEQ